MLINYHEFVRTIKKLPYLYVNLFHYQVHKSPKMNPALSLVYLILRKMSRLEFNLKVAKTTHS
jgi:hypothetical protein